MEKSKSHLFQKGQSGNPEGRPKGAISFKTKWMGYIEKLAKKNGSSFEDEEQELLEIALTSAKKGDYRFWQDIFDRVYGKPVQTTELTGKDGGDVGIKINVVNFYDQKKLDK